MYQNSIAVPSEPLTDFVNESVGDTTQFQGLSLAPQMGVSAMTGTFPKITIAKGNLGRAATRRRAPGTNYNRWQSAIDKGELALEQIGEEQSIPDEIAMEWDDYFDIEQMASAEALERLRRGHEIEVAGTMMNDSNFTAVNPAVNYTLATKATIDLRLDIITAIRAMKATGINPDTVVIPGPLYDILTQATLLKEFIAGSLAPGVVVDQDSIQRSLNRLGITRVVVPDGYVNRSDDGNDDVIEPIWGDDYIWVGRTSTGGLRTGGALRTAYWDKFSSNLFNVTIYREETKKQDVVRDEMVMSVVVTDSRAGRLIRAVGV